MAATVPPRMAFESYMPLLGRLYFYLLVFYFGSFLEVSPKGLSWGIQYGTYTADILAEALLAAAVAAVVAVEVAVEVGVGIAAAVGCRLQEDRRREAGAVLGAAHMWSEAIESRHCIQTHFMN